LSRACDVCHEYKEVVYCSLCGAYLCSECKKRYGARIMAALRKHVL
jgi:hypothetical protein